MRKKELLEELKTAHNWTDHWASLVNGLIGENQKLLKQNGDLRVENATLRERVVNATLRERLRKNPPEDQEGLTADDQEDLTPEDQEDLTADDQEDLTAD